MDITWVRPSGLEITTKNTESMISLAKIQGWKKKSKPKKAVVQDDNSKSDH